MTTTTTTTASEEPNLGPHTYRKRLAKMEADHARAIAALEEAQARTLAKCRRERAARMDAVWDLKRAQDEVTRLTRQNRALWAEAGR